MLELGGLELGGRRGSPFGGGAVPSPPRLSALARRNSETAFVVPSAMRPTNGLTAGKTLARPRTASPKPRGGLVRRSRSASVPVPCQVPMLPIALPSVTDTRVRGDGKLCTLQALDNAGDQGAARYVSPAVAAAVVRGEHADYRHLVVDCRFPYEFDGGHIDGAVNAWTDEMLTELFFTEPVVPPAEAHRTLVILHCEFTSHRAPAAMRLLRAIDRQINLADYPNLTYPEVYLLCGGYEAFYAGHPDLCTPHKYRLMRDPAFEDQCEECFADKKRSKARASANLDGVVAHCSGMAAEARAARAADAP